MAIKFLNTVQVDTDVLYVDASSNKVGIGTTNPQVKLHVSNGTLRTWTPTSGTSAIFESTVSNRNFVTIAAANEAELWFGDATTQAKGRIRYEISNGILNLERMEFWTNSTEQMVINFQGDVGIGTADPNEKLHVSGSSNVRLEVEATDSTVAALKLTNTAGSYASFVNASGSLSVYDYNANDTRTILLTNGNFGIATISPNSKLHVNGEIDASGGDGYRINGKPWAAESSGNLRLGDWDGEGFTTSIFDDNSAEIVIVKDYGTMINCSSLTSSFGANASLAVGTAGATSSGAAVVTLSNSDTTSSAGDVTGIIQFAIKDDNSGGLGYTSASIQGSISQAAGSGNGGGGILDFLTATATTGSSPQTRMRIKDSGNVGIGTTNPGSILHLEETDPTLKILSNQYYGNSKITMGNGLSEAGFISCFNNPGISSLELRYDNGSTGDSAIRVGQRYLEFRIDSGAAMYINSSKNVGIGTTGPSAKLDVVQATAANGAAALHLIGPNTNPGLTSSVLIIEQSDGKKITIDGNDIDVSSGDLFINDYSGEDVTFGGQIKVTGGGSPAGDSYFANGNVGIGTTNPSEKLEVAGKVYIESQGVAWNTTTPGTTRGALHFDPVGNGANDTGNAITFGASDVSSGSTAQAGIYTRTDGAYGTRMYLATTDSYASGSKTRMTIYQNGNVGIGSLTPGEKLDVVGNIKVSGEQYFNGTIIYGDGKEIIKYSDTWLRINQAQSFTNGIYCGSGILRTDGNFQVGPSGSKLTVNSSGNVGIGVTNPNVRLEIGGGSALARVLPSINNQGYIGDSQHRWQAIYATNGTIQTSDIREKTEIKPTELGLDFINDLNPVSYKWAEGERLDASKDERNHQGLIAQEVAETLEKHGVDKNKFGGLDIQKTDEYDDFHAMSYEQLIAPMIKSIQELKAEIEELKKQINK